MFRSNFQGDLVHMSSSASLTHAVIIPHYNDVARLMRCLRALMAQDTAGIEVVVVDNGSSQSLDPVKATHPQVRIYREEQKGAGPARNRGVAETTAPWILFIDADCVPAPNWLVTARRIATPGTVIGGRVDLFDETDPPRSGAEAFEAVFAFRMRAYLEEKSFLGAGNLLVSRQVFEDTGLFRAAVSEDVDWSRRAAAKGHVLSYDDDLAASHPSRSDWRALAHKWRRLTSEGFQLSGMGPTARVKWGLKALAMPASILLHSPRVFRCAVLSGQEKFRALGTLARIRLARMIWMLSQAISGKP